MKDNELIELTKQVKPDISDSARDLYKRTIKTIYMKYHKKPLPKRGEKYEIDNLDFILDFDVMYDLIKLENNRTQGNYASAITSFPMTAELNKKYKKITQNSNKIKKDNEENDIVSANKEEKYKLDFEDINNLINDLRKDKMYKESLIVSLMYHYGFRNEVRLFKIIKLKEYKHLQDPKGNYIVVGTKRLFISRGEFKTDKIYGLTKTDITDKQLKTDILRNVLPGLSSGDYIFTHREHHTGDLVPYSATHLSTLLHRIGEKRLKVGIGTNAINNLFMKSLDDDTIQKLKDRSGNRGTSINTLINTYHNNIK